jgi:MFS family permease
MEIVSSSIPRRPRIYLGWWLVGGSMVLQLLHGALFWNVFGIYVVALTGDFGWSVAAVSSGYALMQLQSGLLGPAQGWVLDRLGPRRVIAFGTVLFAVGMALLASSESLLGFYLALLAVGSGAALAGYLSLTTAIVPWFRQRRATAMALMAVGGSLGGLLVPAVAGAVVAFGWRSTALASAVLALLIGLPAAALIRRDPARYGQQIDGGYRGLPDGPRTGHPGPQRSASDDFSLREALATRAFWMIGVGHGAALLVVSSVVVHLVPHLTRGEGMSLTAAAAVVSALTLVTGVAHALGGVLGDRFSKRHIAVWAMFAHAAGILALVWLPLAIGIPLFLVLHGGAWGVRGPLMGAMRADYFGASHFGAIMGASTVVFMVGQLAGPTLAGAMADIFGNYRYGFTILAVLAGFGSLAFYLATPPVRSGKTSH